MRRLPRTAVLVAAGTLGVGISACGGSSALHTRTDSAIRGLPRAVWGGPTSGRKPRALVLLVHGGGWAGIDPVAFKATLAVATLVQRLGYETLTVEYRRGAQGVSDVEAFYHEARTRVGPRLPICAFGSSAGGHIALMLAVRNPDLNCAIDLAGPSDLPRLHREAAGASAYRIALRAFGGASLTTLSPALHANSIKAKLLLVYAQNDPLVPVSQGREMARADPRARLIVLPPGPAGFVHTGVGAPISTTGVDRAALAKAQAAEISVLASAAAH